MILGLRVFYFKRPRSQEKKKKLINWTIPKFKAFANQRTLSRETRQLMEWKKTIAKNLSDKRFKSKIHKELPQLNYYHHHGNNTT